MTKLELTDREVSALVASIDFMAQYIRSTLEDMGDEYTSKKIELITQLSIVMDKLDNAV